MKRLAIIGSGDLGIQVAWHAHSTGKYTVVGFFDDTQTKGTLCGTSLILGGTDDVERSFQAAEFDCLFIAIGYKHMAVRSALFERFYPQIPFATIIHSSAYVDSSAKVGAGSILYPGCVVDMDASIGNNVLLNVNCTVAHHTSIGDHSFLSPAVSLAGFIQIAPKVVLGIGSIVIDSIAIGENIRTGAGAVVTKSIQESGLYVGIPAVKIK
jgi:sugar O-acyltransferase (sialic acid O-acetyltransferase NeuD family)